jgi:hypothetical protein
VRHFGGLAATTIAITAVLLLIFGALFLPRSVAWLVNKLGASGSTASAGTTLDESEEGRQRQIDLLWDFYREAQALVQSSDHDRDQTNNALQSIVSGDSSSPGLYLMLKEVERNQNRAAARIRDLPTIPQARQARADLYAGFRARADAAGRFAEYLRSHKLDELWTGKLDQERGDGLIAGAMDALVTQGHSLGIDLTTGRIER